MVLNHYIAQAGICSRRKAVNLIKKGLVLVNGSIAYNPSYRVKPADIVKIAEQLTQEERKIYILLNKPKDYITTCLDEKGRKTVKTLIQHDIKERIYPVGRLDRNTTGLLLLTNDGLLANRLAHPSYNIAKIYQVTVSSLLSRKDFQTIQQGIMLDDGLIVVDNISYISGFQKNTIMIELHNGKNRIIRRLFEKLGYTVIKLDRIVYAGLVKKGLSVGSYRYLNHSEIVMLKKLAHIS